MTLREALNYGKMQLKEADIEEYALDAWLLMEHITGISKAMFFVKDKEEMEISCQKRYLEAIDRRKNHIPLQHITGVQEFMGYEFYVNEHVLIPRQDTEILVEEAHRMCQIEGGRKILDLCCGSGCIILSLLKMDDRRTGIGSDISQKALVVAERNRVGLGLSKERVQFQKSDLFDHIKGKYDLIVSNPPYIRTEVIRTLQEEVRLHDPYEALDGKEDGLYFYRRIIQEAGNYLNEKGILLFEIGFDQAQAVKSLMESRGYSGIWIKKDLAGLDRVVGGVYNKARENEEELTDV